MYSMRSVVRLACLFILLNQQQVSAQCLSTIAAFPYSESFESGAAGWISGGSNSDWVLGTPAKSTIGSAGDGVTCWITGGLSGSSYLGAQRSWLLSPCYDLSSLSRPEVSFLIFWETEYQYDGGNLQYSLDGGTTWRTLGGAGSNSCYSENWYTISSITNLSGLANPSAGWSGTVLPTSGSCRGGNGSGGWVTATYCLQQLQGSASVRFRFTFGSGTTCNDYDGIAIDRFEIRDLVPRSTSIGVNCLSTRTVLFEDLQPACSTGRNWLFGDGTTESNAAAVLSHTYPSEGEWSVQLFTNHPCYGAETTTVAVTTLGYLAQTTPVSCAGSDDGSIRLTCLPSSISGVTVNWTTPGLNGWSPDSLPAGDYVFSIVAPQACPMTDTVSVGLDPAALTRADLGPDRFFCPDLPRALFTSEDFSSYRWQDGSTGDSLLPFSDGWYWVEVRTVAGCTSTDSVYLEVNCMDVPIFPSAFTPNGDAINDMFKVEAGAAHLLSWDVYDRWGQVVFSADRSTDEWTGEGFQEGVYTCIVQYIGTDGLQQYRAGRITLIR
ncbi:MAG: hypothetical protein RL021_1837 [Bacteroidota bacterium]|jgi:gliding motility-associated-like protein